jgi:hypothetical protein
MYLDALLIVSLYLALSMTEEPLRTLRFLLARLERISADSVVAHRASGIRGAMFRALDQLEKQEQACPEVDRGVSEYDVKRLIESGYALLNRAARERIK